MANNLRYLLEHFCLDGQKIDISSQLDEENSNNIEKINTQTIPSINARIDDIKNTDIPNINSQINSIKNTDIPSINQKINTINNTTIPNIQESVTAVDEKADRINASVAKNTRDIGTLSDNVTMQGNAINIINTEKIPSVENNIENLTTSINGLTTKVNTNTDSINELSTKVNINTDSINTINNTSIPHLQSEIDNLSGGGTGSVGELREKVEKNTSDISELNGKVDTNTAAISTINDTSIPNLQNQIDNLSTNSWAKTYEHKFDSHSATITQYFNEKIKMAFITIQFHTDDNWVDRKQCYTWEVNGLHNPLKEFIGIIHLVSGVNYICGTVHVSKDNRTNGTSIQAQPSRNVNSGNVMYGCVMYITE